MTMSFKSCLEERLRLILPAKCSVFSTSFGCSVVLESLEDIDTSLANICSFRTLEVVRIYLISLLALVRMGPNELNILPGARKG